MIDAREARIAAEASEGFADKRDYAQKLAEIQRQKWLALHSEQVNILMRPIWDKIADASGYGCTSCEVYIGDGSYTKTEINIREYYRTLSPFGHNWQGVTLSLRDLRSHIAKVIIDEVNKHGFSTKITDISSYETKVIIKW